MGFTFKTEKATGMYRSFYPDLHEIKYKRKACGQILEDKLKGYKVRLMIIKQDILEDGNPNCKWKWIQFKPRFKTLQDAKDWVNKGFDVIMKTYNIYCQEG